MGDLIVLGVVSRAVAERRLDLRQRVGVRGQERGGSRQAGALPDLGTLHGAGIRWQVAGIKPNGDHPVVGAWLEARLFERVSCETQNRAA